MIFLVLNAPQALDLCIMAYFTYESNDTTH